MDDLDHQRLAQFIRTARRVRKFPLAEDVPSQTFLKHVNLLNKGHLTNAAVLLFGKSPQRFLPTSEIKCARFHGTWVAKPIPSYQVYRGTVFDLVDQAADFVLGKIDLSVGTRAESARAPVSYEIPKEVVMEAIVNAVVHRDYASNGSVQVMLFKDRLEVRNPGTLPTRLTLDQLRVPHNSVPTNPLLAHAMYLVEYIEKMGTGTLDMIRRCAAAGLAEPEFAVMDGFVATIRRPVEASFSGGQAEGQAEDQGGPSRGPSRRPGGAKPGAKPNSSRQPAAVEPRPRHPPGSRGRAGVAEEAVGCRQVFQAQRELQAAACAPRCRQAPRNDRAEQAHQPVTEVPPDPRGTSRTRICRTPPKRLATPGRRQVQPPHGGVNGGCKTPPPASTPATVAATAPRRATPAEPPACFAPAESNCTTRLRSIQGRTTSPLGVPSSGGSQCPRRSRLR